MFTEKFGAYVCAGDTISCEVDDLKAVATLHCDDADASPPWNREDGHGPVSPWRDLASKGAGERVLCLDHNSARFYDFTEACEIALKDNWGVAGGRKASESKKAYAARAAERDFAVLKAWCSDEWRYYGVAVVIFKDDVQLTGEYDHALWGAEGNYPDSDNSYLCGVANALLDGALTAARTKLAKLRE